ncbi:lipid kinase [Methylopila sp. M107]|uniref:lipid kinase n=1 Tax=Methylopila sp. M107 TaxID=1101190 RepID=UPI0003AAA885|nr:lipid kinase [Methylopila sp. M107]
MTRKALLIVNAKSRSGAEARDRIVAALSAHDVDSEHGEADGREGLARLIAERGPAFDLIVAAGGDGTMNAAAPGVLKAKRPLGVIPTGTANDLARTLGIPPNIEAAAQIVAEGAPRAIDLGVVNDVPFFNVASVGLSVELARQLTSDLKSRYGRFGYAVAAFRALAHAKPFRAKIKADGRTVRLLTLQVAVGNGVYYGGGNRIEEYAAIDDGRLDLYSLEFVRAWRLALMLKALRMGQHGSWKEIRSMRGEAFELRTHHPRPVNADGEILTETPATFGVLKKAIEVIAPTDP